MNGGVSLIPIIISQRIFQNIDFGLLLLILFQYFFKVGIANVLIILLLLLW
jgi:hypothetical protein